MENTLTERVRQRLEAILPKPAAILLAVSGGSDSMGLLHLLAALRESLDMRLSIGFVDHGLRNIEAEYALVEARARALDIPLERLEIPKAEAEAASQNGSLQAWARGRRYDLLTGLAKKNGCAAVATGHTLDDQAETVMLRLLRGCGIDGLRGMAPSRPLDDDIALIRPLLWLERAEIRTYLSKAKAPFADDPSNQNSRFLRVRVRGELLPLMDTLQRGIARRLVALADDASAVVSFMSSNRLVPDTAFRRLRLGSGVRVDHAVFEQVPRALVGRIVRSALEAVNGDLRRFERRHVTPIEAAIVEGRSTHALPLPGDIEAHVFRGDLFVFKSPLPDAPEGTGHPLAVGAGQWKARFAALGALAEIRADGFEHLDGVVMRRRRPGDRVYGSHKRFKEILIRARVPRPYRDFVPILAMDDEVIACPGFLPSRKPELQVNWMFDEKAPFLDIDFA